MSSGFPGHETPLGWWGPSTSGSLAAVGNDGVDVGIWSTCVARERLREGSRNEEAREAGALCTLVWKIEVVGLESFQRLESEGSRRLSRTEKLSDAWSPDLRRFGNRSLENSLLLNRSSPGLHSSIVGDVAFEWNSERGRRCSQM